MRLIVSSLLLAVVCTTTITGCATLIAGGAAGAGTLAYIRGELREQLAASPRQTRHAIDAMINELELERLKEEADQLSGTYVVQSGGDKKITITYHHSSETLTELRIRVGVFGDESLSRTLLGVIKKHL